jgi:hypothetical protein
MRALKVAILLLGLASPALAGPYSGTVISTTAGIQTDNLSGVFKLARSSTTSTIYTIEINGVTGEIRMGSGTVTGLFRAGTLDTSLIRGAPGGGGIVLSSNTSVTGAGGLTVTYGINGATLTVTNTANVTGGGGLVVTYGISAATLTATTSASITGPGGLNVTYGLTAGTVSVSGGLTASSGTFTATGAGYSVTTSSGIKINSGCIRFSATGNEQCDAAASTSTAAGLPLNNVLTGTNTFTGAALFTGTVTINNVAVGAVGVSSQTPLPYYTTIAAGLPLNVCVPGSTMTATYAGGTRAHIVFSGVVKPNGMNFCHTGLLQDGQYMCWGGTAFCETSTNGLSAGGDGTNNAQSQTFDVFTETLSAGVHSFCLTLASGSSSCTVGGNPLGNGAISFLRVTEVAR